ncbi:MAG TPA: peptidylprolyl isomerase [Actinomycetota bacterium]|nr:peptidylprolyl isomerase [Actinomycetota bacterium]
MSRKSRNRQLAKLAQRRYEERRRQQRKRATIIGVAFGVALIGLAVLGFEFLTGNGPNSAASGTPTPSAAAPGTKTGTVEPSPGPKVVACGAQAPKGATKPKPQFAGPPPMRLDASKTYTATIETSCGTFRVRLLADQAPQTVNSFVFLSREGFYDATRIHRIDTSLDIIQGGDPKGTGTGGPGYSIKDELSGKESYGPGVVAMANAGPNTGGSQFFVVYGDKGHTLDPTPNYTIFGRVVKGLDVVRRIAGVPLQGSSQQPKQAVYLDKVTIDVSG